MEKIKTYQDQLDKELARYPVFNKVEALTGIPKSVFVGGAGAFFVLMIVFNFAGSFLTSLVGWVYPAYASFKAIESPEQDDDKQWLTYWMVLGFINIIEYFSDFLLYWVPFYFLVKTVFLVWLSHPYYRGAEVVYKSYLRDFLNKHSETIDKYLSRAKKAAQDVKQQ
ncbi:ER membrane protein DP1/Yop1 [Entomophthora muscae]|uniref:ER membrane protein DP1/Yop1 n=2 Tax=Entomophthora muscae TaxID=34485 RepID=A0ACC2TQ13_9FUNG|nr:ER membrane protein DP1/Yop1 [Entomophthora muscae]KAJ9087129.1 ER membrane protein DP1/Yop1 [Entomophthora muscae]